MGVQELLRASQCAASAAPMFLLAFGRRGLGLTHRVDADSDSREYIPTGADSRFTVLLFPEPPPFRSVSLITEQLARRPPRRAALGALLSHVAPHGIGTPLARRTSWHLGNQLGRLETLRLVVDFRSSRARSGRVGHHVGFVSRPSQPWILHRRENIRETRELQIAASRVPA